MELAPGKFAILAIAATVSSVAVTFTASETDHQQAPTITMVRAAAMVGLWARRRQVTTATAANTTAAAA